MNEVSRQNILSAAPLAPRIYTGRPDTGVSVRENGQSRRLDPRPDMDRDGLVDFAWGRESPAGERLARAILADALQDDAQACKLAEAFNKRVISILPARWSMTYERVLSYAEMLARQSVEELLPGRAPPIHSEVARPKLRLARDVARYLPIP